MSKKLVLITALIGSMLFGAGCATAYDPMAELEKAKKLYDEGNVAEAHAAYEAIIENDPSISDAYM